MKAKWEVYRKKWKAESERQSRDVEGQLRGVDAFLTIYFVIWIGFGLYYGLRGKLFVQDSMSMLLWFFAGFVEMILMLLALAVQAVALRFGVIDSPVRWWKK